MIDELVPLGEQAIDIAQALQNATPGCLVVEGNVAADIDLRVRWRIDVSTGAASAVWYRVLGFDAIGGAICSEHRSAEVLLVDGRIVAFRLEGPAQP